MTSGLGNLEHKPTVRQNRYAIIIEKKDSSFNCFLVTRKETSSPSEIIFSIVKVIDIVNKHDSINFDTNDELSDFKNDTGQRTIQ